ncbi:MAG: class I SAM-dependent methyltransferase [Spirochaetes bacterium]|nr:class I SAM-dependent methyltransferase [Spirochaetota bacterium]
MKSVLKRLKLNLNVVKLFLQDAWLSHQEVGESYDQLADQYDGYWLVHLKEVTDQLLKRLPENEYLKIIDLGCGTGYTTHYFTNKYPQTEIYGVDVSLKMLDRAQRKIDNKEKLFLYHQDMLEYLQSQPDQSADLILSAWAIGYSYSKKIIQQSARTLKKGGLFAFVVNNSRTLLPVFKAFQQTMRAFPDDMEKILLPRFPRNWQSLMRTFQRNRLEILFHQENTHLIREQLALQENFLPWLLKTGILAGFDQMFDLDKEEIQVYFENQIHKYWQPLYHSYIMAIGEKK